MERLEGKTGSRLFTEVKALLDGVDIWMSDHLDNLPVLYSLGSQQKWMYIEQGCLVIPS